MGKTIDQALQEGVAAHKAGELKEAERLYKIILNARPNHPDANHNLGILSVSRGKVEEALPFLKCALETNRQQVQFWISYISALIKADRLDSARQTLQQGRNLGVKGDQIDLLEKQLSFESEPKLSSVDNAVNPSRRQLEELVTLHRRGKLKEALVQGSALASRFPDNPIIPNILGAIYAGLGKQEEAFISYKRAIELQPDLPEIHLNLASILNLRAQKENAVSSCIKAVLLKPNFAEAYYNLGNTLNLLGRSHEAILSFNRAVKIKSDYPEAYNNLGMVLENILRLEEALINYERAIRLKPDYSDACYNSANILTKLGKYHGAVNRYNRAIELKPKFAEAYYNLGNAHNELGHYRDAIISYERATKLRPNYAEAHNNLGNSLKNLNKYHEAIASYKKAIKFEPKYTQAYSNLANCLKDTGRHDEAVLCYQRSIIFRPDHAIGYNNLGTLINDFGKYAKAINFYKRAIKITPNYADAHNNIGHARNNLGRSKKAYSNYKNAIKLFPGFVEAYWNKHSSSQSISAAIDTLSKAVTICPSHVKSLINLAGLKAAAGCFSDFDLLNKTSLASHPFKRSFDWFFQLNKVPKIYFDRWNLFDAMIALSVKSRPFYEYGVWTGVSFHYLIKNFEKGYGFDTFSGLPADWHNEKAGAYNSFGEIPKIKGGEFIAGKFEDTLPIFFADKRPKASIINFDADLYSSTLCALRHSRKVIDEKTILIFDEFIMTKDWEKDEYQALNDFCAESGLNYEVLAVSFFTKQVAVKLIK